MACRAVKANSGLPVHLQEPFRERLAEVVRSSSEIGWGYHDELTDSYIAVFVNQQ
jgi:hypothetical protein